jgi:cytidine deaminase
MPTTMTADRCPADSDLLILALHAGRSGIDLAPVERHVAECGRCREIVLDLRRSAESIATSRGSAVEGGPGCLDAAVVVAVVDGSLPSAERNAVVAHLAVCGHCRAELAEISSALRDPAIDAAIRPIRTTAAPMRARVAGLGLLAAAAAAIVIIAGRRPQQAIAPQLRDDALPAVAPVAVAPNGRIAGLTPFRWSTVAGADLYHVTVFTSDGTIAWEGETGDTTIAAPATAGLLRDVDYFWKVDARTEFDRWTASRMMEFHLTRGGAR